MADSPIPWTPVSPYFDELWVGDTESDIDPTTTVPDTLSTIFAQQRRLMEAVWPKEIHSGLSTPIAVSEWGELDFRRVQARIHETFGHLVRELSEAMAHLDGSKSWKAQPRETNIHDYHEEIADAFHFFVEFCILSGLDAESLFRQYFAKSLVNFNRNASGY